jgi:hypothetical protein
MGAEENSVYNSAILQIFNKTKRVNLVSNVADAPDDAVLGWRSSNMPFRITAWQ